MSGAAEAGNHLVGDEQNVMPAADLLNMLEITPWRDDDAAGALNGFGDEGRNAVGTDLGNPVGKP